MDIYNIGMTSMPDFALFKEGWKNWDHSISFSAIHLPFPLADQLIDDPLVQRRQPASWPPFRRDLGRRRRKKSPHWSRSRRRQHVNDRALCRRLYRGHARRLRYGHARPLRRGHARPPRRGHARPLPRGHARPPRRGRGRVSRRAAFRPR